MLTIHNTQHMQISTDPQPMYSRSSSVRSQSMVNPVYSNGNVRRPLPAEPSGIDPIYEDPDDLQCKYGG